MRESVHRERTRESKGGKLWKARGTSPRRRIQTNQVPDIRLCLPPVLDRMPCPLTVGLHFVFAVSHNWYTSTAGASSSQDVYSPEECPQTPSVHVEQAESPGSPPMEAIRLEPRQRFRTHRDDVMDGFWVLVSHQWHQRKWNLFWLLVGMLAMRWWCGPQKTLS